MYCSLLWVYCEKTKHVRDETQPERLKILSQEWMDLSDMCHAVVTAVLTQSSLSATGSDGAAAPWTTEEQKLLEQALKTYAVSTPERWEKIAAAVPGRSKKDCMKRYKVSWRGHLMNDLSSLQTQLKCNCYSDTILLASLTGAGGDGQSQESCTGASDDQEQKMTTTKDDSSPF